MLKQCTACKQEKHLSDFRKDAARIDGVQSWCKICARKYASTHHTQRYAAKTKARNDARASRTRKWVEQYKRSRMCCICGETEYVCLEFHHLDPTQKEFTISGNFMRRLDLVQIEIQKCVVLCSNCHKKVHAGIIKLESGQAGNAAPC